VKESAPRRRWIRPLILALLAVAIVGGAGSFLLLSQWTDVTQVTPAEVDRVFSEAIAEAGGGLPYVEIVDNGIIIVHREQEMDRAMGFNTLTLLAWSPRENMMIRMDYPSWFVRLKTSSSLNLGTMIAAASKDWGHLDLRISYADLLKRGPGLILNHNSGTGARILIWTWAD